MGASIREVLAEKLVGSSTPLDWNDVSKRIARMIKHPSQVARRKEHRERQEFYMDRGHPHVDDLIEKVIQDKTVKTLRKQWIEAAGYNPLTRRVVDAKSTVYQDAAVRSVKGDKNDEKYKKAQARFDQHDRSRQWNRLSNLHRTLLVGVRVRNIGSQDAVVLEPRLDIVTPAQILTLITSPKDPTRIEGVVIELSTSDPQGPHSVLWTNHEIGYLNKEDELMAAPKPHGFDRMPFVLLRLDDDTGSLWSTIGASLISAHKADWFCKVCMLKETKSATKLQIMSGDLTSTSRQQTMDSESVIELSDGVASQVVDMSMDLSMFRETGNDIVDTIGSANGIAPMIMTHGGVQSAAARDAMRIPLREIRLEQHSPLRKFERELAVVQSMVLKKDMPELSFEMVEWSIDFADPQSPRSEKEKLEEFEHSNRLNLTSAIKHVMERNPDLTREMAEEELRQNALDKLWMQIIQRPFMELTGAMHGKAEQVPPTLTGDEGDDNPDGRSSGDANPEGREGQS